MDFENIKSIAIIGSSNNSQKIGYDITKNILDYGYKGSIFPVNTHEESILGLRVYKSILDIDQKVDLCVIAIPAEGVANVLEDCVKKFIPLVVIVSAGFKETGNDDLQNELNEIIKNTSTRVIGPNCLGLISSKANINVSFAANFPKYDSISFISQSGALGTAFLDWTGENNLGIDNFISIGNKIDIDENYLLENIKDEKVIACYLEDIKDGKEFMRIGFENNVKRPVIVLKPGKTQQANNAITSHTGTFTTGHIPISVGLKQSGYIEVNTIGNLFNMIKGFAWLPIPKDGKTAIITNAGGPAVIATDQLVEKGLQLAQITDETQKILKDSLPREASIRNPIDLVGDALSDRFYKAMDAVLNEKDVSSLIVILTPQIMTQIEQTAKFIGEMKKYNKPVLASFIGGTLVEKGIKLLSEEKVPAYQFPETAIDVLSALVEYSNFVNSPTAYIVSNKKSKYYKDSHTKIMDMYMKAKESTLDVLSSNISEQIAKMYGINIPLSFKCATIEEAITLANTNVKYPCILKISSSNLIHKTEIGGVVQNIQNKNELKKAFLNLEGIIHNKGFKDAYIEIQKFIQGDINLIIGANRDDNFGNILIFGQGGIYTEIIDDISRRVTPIDSKEILKMINETKISKVLKGFRNQEPFNLDPIINTIESVQYLIDDYPFIKSIDINPLIVKKDEAYAVDIKILI